MANNDQQIEHWNGEAGQRWAEHDSALEKTLAPVTAALLSKVTVHQDIQVLDIGCGLGRMAIPLTQYLQAPQGSYHGVDLVASALAWNTDAITSVYKNFTLSLIHISEPTNTY